MADGSTGANSSKSDGWGSYIPDLGITSTAYWVGSGAYSFVPDIGLARAVWGSREDKSELIDPVRVTTIHEAVIFASNRLESIEDKELTSALQALIEVIALPLETVPGCKQVEVAARSCDVIEEAINGVESPLKDRELPCEVSQFFAALKATVLVMKIFPACQKAQNRIAIWSEKRETAVNLRRQPIYRGATPPQKEGFDRIVKVVGEAIETAKEQLESAEEERTKALSMLLPLLTMGPREKKEAEGESRGQDEISARLVEAIARSSLEYAGNSLGQCDVVERELPSARAILDTEVEA